MIVAISSTDMSFEVFRSPGRKGDRPFAHLLVALSIAPEVQPRHAANCAHDGSD